MIVGSGAAERFHMRWFASHLPERGVAVRPIATERPGFALAGPQVARAAGAGRRRGRLGRGLPLLRHPRAWTSACAPALVARVSFTGELGFEIYVEAAYAARRLRRPGAGRARTSVSSHFGGRALNSLRLEKSFGAWLREYTPDYTPCQAGLARFIDFDKGDFVGREAALRQRDEEPAHRLVTLVVDAADADAYGDEPVLAERPRGRLRHLGRLRPHGRRRASRSPIVEPAHRDCRRRARGHDPGRVRPARLAPEPLYDPSGARMRS